MYDPFQVGEGIPYARCACGEDFEDRTALIKHWEVESGAKHRANISNPTREERIDNAVEREVFDALDEALESIQRYVANSLVTEEEMRAAAKRFGDIDLYEQYSAWLEG